MINATFRMLTAMVLTGCIIGCTRNHYELELRPSDHVVARRLTVWYEGQQRLVAGDGVSPQELERLARVLPERFDPKRGRACGFAGRFTESTPDDIGGAGTFARCATDLGTLCLYAERFRGEPDMAAALDRRRAAVTAFFRVVSEWLEHELGQEPHYPRLRDALRERIPRDAWNVSLVVWAAVESNPGSSRPSSVRANADREHPSSEQQTVSLLVARITQYLVERGYIAPADFPFIRAVVASEQAAPVSASRALRRLVARQMGIDPAGPFPAGFAFLDSNDALSDSFAAFLGSSERAHLFLREWADARSRGGSDSDTNQLWSELCAACIGQHILEEHDQVDVRLACSSPPIATNGEWDESAGELRWSSAIETTRSPGDQPPALTYAVWSEPAESFQKEHLGSVLLSGADLGEYCLWHNALPPEDASRWDTLIRGLSGNVRSLDPLRRLADSDSDADVRLRSGASIILKATKGPH